MTTKAGHDVQSGARSGDHDGRMSLTDRASRGMVWLTGQTIVTRLIAVAGQILLARLLLREDYGLFAMAAAVVAFTEVLRQAGFIDILVQRHATYRHWANPTFWMSISLGLLASMLAICIAPWAASFYSTQHPDRIVQLIALLSVKFPLESLGIVPLAQLQIQMRFRMIATITAVASLLDMALRVILAWLGFGAMSFVIPAIIIAAGRSLTFLAIARPPLRWWPQFRRWKYLVADSSMIIGASVCFRFIREGDYLVLGRFEPETIVGVYYFAFTISIQSLYVFLTGVSSVLFPALSKLQREPARQASAFLRATRMLATIVMPVCFLQAALAEPLVRLLFPERWFPAIPLIQLLSLGMALRIIGPPSLLFLRAQGRFGVYLRMSAISAVMFFSMAVVGVWLGSVTGLAIAVACYYALESLLHSYVALSSSDRGLRDILGVTLFPLCASAVAIGAGSAVGLVVNTWHLERPWLEVAQVALVSLTGTTAYAVIVKTFAPDMWVDLMARLASLSRVRVSPSTPETGERTLGP